MLHHRHRRDAARAAQKPRSRRSCPATTLGPLHGVPVSIKDLIPTKGVRTTFGSIAFADNVPDRDDVLVTRLRAAGAIMIGKTTTPEFGIKGQTDAPIYGVTRNPVEPRSHAGRLERRRGGRGRRRHRPIGLGSDGAGSTRIPAACCGLVGLKGTTGAIPYQEARDAFANVIAAGPLTRTIADCAVMQSVMAGADPDGSVDARTQSRSAACRRQLLSQDLTGLRIGYLSRTAATKVSAEVDEGRQGLARRVQRSRRGDRGSERRR